MRVLCTHGPAAEPSRGWWADAVARSEPDHSRRARARRRATRPAIATSALATVEHACSRLVPRFSGTATHLWWTASRGYQQRNGLPVFQVAVRKRHVLPGDPHGRAGGGQRSRSVVAARGFQSPRRKAWRWSRYIQGPCLQRRRDHRQRAPGMVGAKSHGLATVGVAVWVAGVLLIDAPWWSVWWWPVTAATRVEWADVRRPTVDKMSYLGTPRRSRGWGPARSKGRGVGVGATFCWRGHGCRSVQGDVAGGGPRGWGQPAVAVRWLDDGARRVPPCDRAPPSLNRDRVVPWVERDAWRP